MESNIHIYKNKNGNISVEVKLQQETLWLSLNQMSSLFGRDKSVISRHLSKIYKENELEQKATVAKFATVQYEGKRKVERDVEYYNLDAILSVGYRVNSIEGTHFRKWANSVLKDYLVKGYSLNEKRIAEKGFKEIEEALGIIHRALDSNKLISDLSQSTINIVRLYAKSWTTLLKYDEDRLDTPTRNKNHNIIDIFAYSEAQKAIQNLYKELKSKSEATELFGKEKGQELEGIIGNINQSFGGQALYSTNFERAAHLLYFIIKDHPFVDGNKRIGSFLFILYLNQANISLDKIDENTLIALALLVAESDPKQKELIIKLIMNLLV